MSVHASRNRAVPRRPLSAVGHSRSDVQSCSRSRIRRFTVCVQFRNAASGDNVKQPHAAGSKAERCFEAIRLGSLRGHSPEVAHRNHRPFLHPSCAHGRVLETRAQDVIRLHQFVERAWPDAAGRCSPSPLTSRHRARRREQRAGFEYGRAELHPHAAAGVGWRPWRPCGATRGRREPAWATSAVSWTHLGPEQPREPSGALCRRVGTL